MSLDLIIYGLPSIFFFFLGIYAFPKMWRKRREIYYSITNFLKYGVNKKRKFGKIFGVNLPAGETATFSAQQLIIFPTLRELALKLQQVYDDKTSLEVEINRLQPTNHPMPEMYESHLDELKKIKTEEKIARSNFHRANMVARYCGWEKLPTSYKYYLP